MLSLNFAHAYETVVMKRITPLIAATFSLHERSKRASEYISDQISGGGGSGLERT